MTRYFRFSSVTLARALAFAAAFGAVACTARKTENSAGKDTATVSAPAPATTVVPPATSSGAAIVEDSGKMNKRPATMPVVKAPVAGGERDSATQAVFEIGPDGKVRRVKR